MAFTGTAIYDIYTNEVAEDISDIVSMVSPRVTPFLDAIGDAATPFTSDYYTWSEKALLPDTFTCSSAIASTAAASGGIEVGANAGLIRVGDIFNTQTEHISEQLFVSSIGTSAATIYVTRAYAGTSSTSFAAGATLNFIGSALEEGTDPRSARRRGKTLRGNFIQKFREDINIGRRANNAGLKVASQPKPYDEEVSDKTIDALKQLERTAIMGRTNGNTIGADDAVATMAGIYNSIATNVSSHATYSNSFLNNAFESVHNYTDVESNIDRYHLFAGVTAFRNVSNSRASRIEETTSETGAGVKKVATYMSDFGDVPITMLRWLPKGTILGLRKDFIKIAPFQGLSFGQRKYDNGSSNVLGYVEGDYGLEFKQETAHFTINGIG
ncbi:MAG: DUF5309 domain-containing protein [bacterium]|nr:DUF5309 domain-containing protein [bacterium]